MGTVSPLPPRWPASRTGSARRIAKRIVLGLAWICVSPLVALSRLEEAVFGPDCLRAFCTGKELLAFVPGLPGRYLRLAYYWSVCRAVSADASFELGSMLARREISFGAGSVLGTGSIVGLAQIGRDVLIASRVSVFSERYLHGRPEDRVSGELRAVATDVVRIGDECWIGENAVVMASLGARCTVAAGAVVLRAADAGCTLMGNPARRVNL